MAAAMQRNTLRDAANMFDMGLLDDQFQQLQLLQDGSAPEFIPQVVTLFCKDGEQIIGELNKLMDKICVDFDKVDAFVHQLNGSSASVGAHRVKNTCIQFHEFCQEKSRDGCLKTLDAARNDFYDPCFSWSNRFRPSILSSKLEQQNGSACSDGTAAFRRTCSA